jgi:hypothetical protein
VNNDSAISRKNFDGRCTGHTLKRACDFSLAKAGEAAGLACFEHDAVFLLSEREAHLLICARILHISPANATKPLKLRDKLSHQDARLA